VQLIETSLISAHFANLTNTVYLDVFSCKPYDPEVVEESQDIVGGAVLGVGGRRCGDVGRRIAAGVEGDGAVALAEMPHLGFPAAAVAGEFMDEENGRSASGLLVIERYSIVGFGVGHGFLLGRISFLARSIGRGPGGVKVKSGQRSGVPRWLS
jgi:hypothetical protein